MGRSEPDSLSTTVGACAICNRQRPAGWRATRDGALLLGGGIVLGLASWFLHVPALSGLLCSLAVGLGGPLLLFGILRSATQTTAFATGRLTIDRRAAVPGQAIRGRLLVHPEHPLTTRALTCELQACEESDAARDELTGAVRVLRSVELPVEAPGAVSATFTRSLELRIPADWPATMEAPHEEGLPRVRVFSRVRAAVDFEAHPLLELERRLAIAARTAR